MTHTSDTLELARELIRRPSVTPEDADCQKLLAERLGALGFAAEWLSCGEVTNLWARRGEAEPLFVFAGHTDVVPPGPDAEWHSPPFEPTERDGWLYGRGAADMKGSLAAFVTACERYLARHPEHAGSLAVLLTSDEEGPGRDGTRHVVSELNSRGEAIRWCLVGEPSSRESAGDVIKNGRRGSLNGRLRVNGVQGHVAYPGEADNPVHRALPALAALTARRWDEGNTYFPPTSLQITNVRAGTGANNVIPGQLEADFNFRFSSELSDAQLREAVEDLLSEHGLDYAIDWRLSGQPFLTEADGLVESVARAIAGVRGQRPELSTAGGTSDGRFIAPTGAQVVELGPANATIHKVNERVAVAELEQLSAIYEAVLAQVLSEAD